MEQVGAIAVKESKLHGKGIFANKDFFENQTIMIIKGEVIDANECIRREEQANNVYIFYMNDDCFLDTAQTQTIKYINHSCTPNAYVDDNDESSLLLKAQQSIAIGEEITINYDYPEIFELCQNLNPDCNCPFIQKNP